MPQVPMSTYYKKTEPPCKDCNDRVVGCHSKCAKYINWKKIQTTEKEKARKYYEPIRKLEDYEIKSRFRTIKRKRK